MEWTGRVGYREHAMVVVIVAIVSLSILRFIVRH